MISYIRCNLVLHKIVLLALLDWILVLHIVPRIRYLGFTTRGKKGPLTTTGDLSTCKSKLTLIQLLTVNRRISLMKECCVSHSVWRELNKWFPVILGNCLVFKRKPLNKCMCMKAHSKVFGVWSREELTNKEIVSRTPSSKCFTHGCAKGFWGEWERQR
jgi:hypothetical protein